MVEAQEEQSFWDHLEDLRWTIMRILISVVVCMLAIFSFKDIVFNDIILAPRNSDFITYRVMCYLADYLNMPSFCPERFELNLININLSGQFFIHMSVSFWLGLIISFPYVLYQVWLFISPALYDHERWKISIAFFIGGLLFFLGVAISYFLIFPLTVRFLGGYQVSEFVLNQISLSSYIGTLNVLCLCMGLMFEMPMVIYLLSTMNLITKSFLKKYRRWAIVILLILSAIITPTADPFTMIVVCLPLLVLYEVSIMICKN